MPAHIPAGIEKVLPYRVPEMGNLYCSCKERFSLPAFSVRTFVSVFVGSYCYRNKSKNLDINDCAGTSSSDATFRPSTRTTICSPGFAT